MLNPFSLNHKNLLKNNSKAIRATSLNVVLLSLLMNLHMYLTAESAIEERVKEKLLTFLFPSSFISKDFMKAMTFKNIFAVP